MKQAGKALADRFGEGVGAAAKGERFPDFNDVFDPPAAYGEQIDG